MNEARENLAVAKLKSSLMKLISCKRIEEISIKEICEDANINRSTFYRHYKDEYALLNDLQEDASNMLKRKMYENPIINEESLVHYLNYIRANIEFFEPMFFSDSCNRFSELFMRDTFNFETDVFRIEDSKKDYIATFIGHGAYNSILLWINNGFDLSAEELGRKIYNYSKAIIEFESM